MHKCIVSTAQIRDMCSKTKTHIPLPTYNCNFTLSVPEISWRKCQDETVRRSDFDQTFRKFVQKKTVKNMNQQNKYLPGHYVQLKPKMSGYGSLCLKNVQCPTIISSSALWPLLRQLANELWQ